MADLTRRATLIIQLQDQISSGAKSAAKTLEDVENRATRTAAANARASESAAKHSQALTKLGNLAKGAVVPGLTALSGALIVTINKTAEFESTFGKISGLTNTAAGDIDNLKNSVLGLSRDLPVSANELAKGLYFVSSSGYQGAEAMKILEMAGKACAAGLGETKTIADAVTSALNAYGLAGSSLRSA